MRHPNNKCYPTVKDPKQTFLDVLNLNVLSCY